MMHRILPPICLVLALLAIVAAFARWNAGSPEADMPLHIARVSGDEDARARLEEDLQARRRAHRLSVVGLFAASALLIAAAFVAMRPPRQSVRGMKGSPRGSPGGG